MGHDVMVVGGSFSHLRSKQPDITSTIKRDTIEGVNYVWLKTNSYIGNGARRAMSMVLFCWRLWYHSKALLDSFKPDLIIASSTYPLDSIPAKKLADKYNATFCFEVHDLWPLSPMELGGYSKYNPFIMVMQWAENFAYKTADLVISMLPNTLEHMIAHGLQRDKFCYIPNGIATEEWIIENESNSHIDFLNKLHADHKVIVGYVGGHAISNALDTLIGVASLAEKENSKLVFVLVGSGAEKDRLLRSVTALSLSNVFFLPPISKRSIPKLLSEMDILYLGWHNNPLYRFGISPNKLIDYMMAGKPVVHSVNAANDLVEESSCGISVPPGDQKGIVDALNLISGLSDAERHAMGMRGRQYVLKNYNYDFLAEKFLDFAKTRM